VLAREQRRQLHEPSVEPEGEKSFHVSSDNGGAMSPRSPVDPLMKIRDILTPDCRMITAVVCGSGRRDPPRGCDAGEW
jgi:hypothetical protein